MRTFSVSFFIGTLLLLLLPHMPSLDALFWGIYFGVFLLLLSGYWMLRQRLPMPVLLLVTGCWLGGGYALHTAEGVLASWLPAAWEGEDVLLSGTIADVPATTVGGLSFVFDADHPEFKGRLRVAWYADEIPLVYAGERWQFLVRGKRPHGFSNPNGFDYEQWLFSQRIGGSAYVRASPDNQRLAEASPWAVNAWRQDLKIAIETALADSPATGLVQGLAVAYTKAITQEQWEVLRDTGTIHLLAISGLHITMVAGLGILPVWGIWRLFPGLYSWLPLRVAAGIAGGGLATGYALLAGFNIPTQRTLLMLLVVLLGLVWRRQIPFSVILATALLAVLLLDPLAALAVGFWLSFITVGLLAWLGLRQRRVGSGSVVWIQLVLSLGLLPLTAGFFGMVSLSSPLANLLAIPVITFLVTPLVLLGIVLVGWWSAAAAWVWSGASILLTGLMAVLEWLAALPLAAVAMPLVPLLWLGVALVGFGLLCLPKGMPGRWLGLLLMLPMLLYQPEKPAEGAFRASVLDVGQGLATVVQTAQHTLVFDTGPKTSDTFDTGALVVLPWLYGQGLRSVDRLLVSHADNDHSGGAQALVNTMSVGDIWVGTPDILPQQSTALCEAGQQWEWDGVQFSVLHPSPAFKEPRDNNRSCMLKVSNAHHSLLLTADIERPVEQWLLKQRADLAADVLLLPHHGSKTSSSPAFINAVAPRLGIVTSGYRNRYHHPHPSVTARYEARGIKLLNTVNSGELRLDFPDTNTAFEIREWRQVRPHIWQKPAM
ncbi:DNA internalization-related competence protein ComEC/Rec2 [Candidatus Thiothrix anitrata]|uniref:DNA internalization-related competence protein ComEC/Rec2 n=1 Tax=Candidatus Thiothrix anitrata TaxID=2823902 RepID=A0ABX7X4I8_9GAMM|nr:DNA internalization-related competence protein ComEC/Rec2 [Candidatus Thiothrix anitrata]QTR48749.1 DNA internalization-related competence protein ComEC/Rec2 [Candidatus Thiothrix anitrata]